jgi:hypothetical protein
MTNSTIETYDTLNDMTVAELRTIVRARKIVGFSKKTKDITIKAILAASAATADGPASVSKPVATKPVATKPGMSHTQKLAQTVASKPPAPVTAAQFKMSSVLTKPSAKKGDKTTTTIQVSCGANSADFPVQGKTVGAVQEFLKEVLNIDRLAEGQVSGNKIDSSYVLKEGDVLEFIKPAGSKG